MTLEEFLAETRHEVLSQVADGQPYAELVFCEVVMQHLQDAGMTFEPVPCHYDGKIGNGRFRLSGICHVGGSGSAGPFRQSVRRL